jgi:Ca2+-binding RTX toxin-like protein
MCRSHHGWAGLSLPLAVCCLLLLPAGAGAVGTPAPSCAEGPAIVGAAIIGTPCADTILAPPWARSVNGGGGNDTILAAPVAASSDCSAGCQLGIGSQTFEGGPGNDIVFGERGNDNLLGGPGEDQLYGGVGDDTLLGGPGNDHLSGGFGADTIDGEGGDDYVRGDATIDRLSDSGGGTDTLSFATGTAPGFGGAGPAGYAGFPAAGGERGVRLELAAGGENADDGISPLGGGVDRVGGGFERIIGTPYSDYIVGTEAGEAIYGGGGADVILGEGGDDTLRGGADGDDLDGGAGKNDVEGGPGEDHCQNTVGPTSCELKSATRAVVGRDTSKVSVGFMEPAQSGSAQLYVTGSEGDDNITANYGAGAVSLELAAGSFDQSASEGGCSLAAGVATCTLSTPLDSLTLAGMGGQDSLSAGGFPSTVGVIVAGGAGDDVVNGGEASEDVLIDGPGGGEDRLSALGGDDALLHNGGPDELLGGAGNDLFLSASICDGERLVGGSGRDNSSWARLDGEGVAVHLDEGRAGAVGPGGAAVCPGGAFDSLTGIDDLEGSEQGDVLVGNAANNNVLGRGGADVFATGPGDDTIFANSADSDTAIDCGEGVDTALIDRPTPEYRDPAPSACETVQESDPESFRKVAVPPPVPAPAPEPAPRRRVDRRPPQTRIAAHPLALLSTGGRSRRVVFRFSSSERGSRFRCQLDRRPSRPCDSPRVFRVALGRHVFRVRAVDAAGNADPSPAVFGFRVRRG